MGGCKHRYEQHETQIKHQTRGRNKARRTTVSSRWEKLALLEHYHWRERDTHSIGSFKNAVNCRRKRKSATVEAIKKEEKKTTDIVAWQLKRKDWEGNRTPGNHSLSLLLICSSVSLSQSLGPESQRSPRRPHPVIFWGQLTACYAKAQRNRGSQDCI